jgi:hypothetical protein
MQTTSELFLSRDNLITRCDAFERFSRVKTCRRVTLTRTQRRKSFLYDSARSMEKRFKLAYGTAN